MKTEKIQEMMATITREWAEQGNPIRPRGTRDGDADRSELAEQVAQRMGADEEMEERICEMAHELN